MVNQPESITIDGITYNLRDSLDEISDCDTLYCFRPGEYHAGESSLCLACISHLIDTTRSN